MSALVIVLAALLAAKAPPAPPQPKVISSTPPAGNVYLDDEIEGFLVPPKPIDDPEFTIKSENLTIVRGESRPYPGVPDTYQYPFVAKPIAPGPAWIEGSVHQRYSQSIPEQPIPRLTFNVLPDLNRASDDPVKVFAMQKAAKRPQLFFHVSSPRPRAWVGQSIEVMWDLISPQNDFGSSSFYPKLDAYKTESINRAQYPAQTAVGGQFVWRKRLMHYLFRSDKAQVIHLPTTEMDGSVRTPDGQETDVMRYPNALDIEFVAPPAEAAHMPIGHYSMKCTQIGSGDYWPSFSVELTGDGDLSQHTAPPRFELEPITPIIASLDYGTPNAVHWTYSIHTHDAIAKLPALTADYFDPDTATVKHTGCPPMEMSTDWRVDRDKREADGAPPEPQDAKKTEKTDEDTARVIHTIAGTIAGLAGLMVLVALRS